MSKNWKRKSAIEALEKHGVVIDTVTKCISVEGLTLGIHVWGIVDYMLNHEGFRLGIIV